MLEKQKQKLHRPTREEYMNDPTSIRVFNVDDHPMLQEGVAAIINSQPDMQLVAQASSGSDAIEKFRGHRPDVTLMDLRLPDMSSIDTHYRYSYRVPRGSYHHADHVRRRRRNSAGPGGRSSGLRAEEYAPTDLVAVIRQVHAGKKRIPSEVAARLAEHLGEENL